MPIIKSAIKRVRQSAKRRSRNLQVKRAIHKDTRQVIDAIKSGDSKKTTEALQAAVSQIDRAVKKGTLHKNTAARRKSQLSIQANAVMGKPAPKPKAAAAKAKPAAKKAAPKKATAKKPAKK